MKTKKLALYSPETHRLNSQFETRDQFRQGARAMMRDNALRAAYYIKQIGGAA
jgi:hypothetical protein